MPSSDNLTILLPCSEGVERSPLSPMVGIIPDQFLPSLGLMIVPGVVLLLSRQHMAGCVVCLPLGPIRAHDRIQGRHVHNPGLQLPHC